MIVGALARMFGGTPPAPVVLLTEKPTDEERAFGAALAAQLKVESPADCRNLGRRLWAGCRAYLRERHAPEDNLEPAARAHDAALGDLPPAAEWPAPFD